jgi:NAD-dependent SIR2 family protein deacetylase
MRISISEKDLKDHGDTHFCRCYKCNKKFEANEKVEWDPLENVTQCLTCYDKDIEEWRKFRESVADNKPNAGQI